MRNNDFTGSVACLERGGRAKWWQRCGSPRRGFQYRDTDGSPVTDERHLARIKALALPPAWTNVRICPSERGKLQAIGMDRQGKLQYRYHARFAARQQEAKYDKLVRFGEALPCLREATNAHLQEDGLSRERVLSLMVRLIGDLYFRVGSEQSATQYRTYGITTLQNRHLTVGAEGTLRFQYTGKRQVRQRRLLVDSEVASLLAELRALPGSRLFQYVTETGKPHPLTPAEVNRYIKGIIGPEFSAKDFRTWGGTLAAALALADMGPAKTEAAQTRSIAAALRQTAERLGNTPAICRSSYVHPKVLSRYAEGITLSDFRPRKSRITKRIQPGYEPEEIALLRLLREP